MINYELIVVTDADDEKTRETIEQATQEHGFNIITAEYEGRKRLTYPIGKHEYAYYSFYRLTVDETNTDAPIELSQHLNTCLPVLRYLLVKSE